MEDKDKATKSVRPITNENKTAGDQTKPAPKLLMEVGSYSGYREMAGKIDGMVKEVFSSGKQMRVKIICEEG